MHDMTKPTRPRYLRFWSGSSTNCRRCSEQSFGHLRTFFESVPSLRFVYGSASGTVWMHSYCRLLAAVFWMMVANGSGAAGQARLLGHQRAEQLHHLNEHPVVAARRQEPEELWRHRQVVLRIFVRQLANHCRRETQEGDSSGWVRK